MQNTLHLSHLANFWGILLCKNGMNAVMHIRGINVQMICVKAYPSSPWQYYSIPNSLNMVILSPVTFVIALFSDLTSRFSAPERIFLIGNEPSCQSHKNGINTGALFVIG